MIKLLLIGFYIGAIHMLSAPAHLAILIPLGLLKKEKSWHVGILWSLGHMIGLFLLGIILFYFKSIINLSHLEHYNFIYIGILLILVGTWIVYKSKYIQLNIKQQNITESIKKVSFSTGLVHGMIGVSHIYTLAPTLSMQTDAFIAYFASFTLGTTATAIILTYLLSFIPNKIMEKENLYKRLCKWSGIIAIIMGVILLIFFFGDINMECIFHNH